MKVAYKGTFIELEKPEEGEQSLDIITSNEENLGDTKELTEEEIERISLLSGDLDE